ncbi:DUF2798 domain-containing protein [Motilimonas cestriensis]|uniref:DUF2798 domain-containing protein n=2 Tax=Alteromonadales genera incertae sedis TaxID=256005 RepID=A0ABS8W3X7_9GAMM|nr:DUF2798 domain-containing protein [Motilimonas cestriensis]MCE0555967.1 DUF2798 domain-containing protein [Motilimonas sp. E26]MCE2593649.1 DUF2798 domain-containing protein [Motilimonas cestriensis]
MKHRIIFAVIMSFVLSLLMTMWVTWLNLGATTHFVQHWLKAFILAWPAAAVISMMFAPRIHRLAGKLSA